MATATKNVVKDPREQGVSYGYVDVPKGGIEVDGVKFPEGPRPAGKKGWFKLLLIAGCPEISQAEYEAFLKGQYPGKETASAAAVHPGRDQGAPAPQRKQPRPRREPRGV